MKENELEKLIKTIETEIVPPEGLKEKLLTKVFLLEDGVRPTMSPFERFLFEKPLIAACCISMVISGLSWAIMGNDFTKLISKMIG